VNRRTTTAAISRQFIDGMVIGGLYLPNGNPYRGQKFDYKLRWLQRLHDYAVELIEIEVPVILAGEYNIMPTELDVYKLERCSEHGVWVISGAPLDKN
jgi:exodeoxyribonuclease-3